VAAVSEGLVAMPVAAPSPGARASRVGGGAVRDAAPPLNRAGFPELCASVLPSVYGYLFNRCGRIHAVAEDLTQETFLAAAAVVRAGSGASVSPAWLIGVARHKLVDHYRRQARDERRARELELRATTGVVASPGVMDTAQELAIEVLEQLRPNQRAALVLHYVDGLPVEEVADVLGKSLHATESLLARGRVAFRRFYGEVADD
jgi:RNA polymerase sigma-70 factor (ECF subfamily)